MAEAGGSCQIDHGVVKQRPPAIPPVEHAGNFLPLASVFRNISCRRALWTTVHGPGGSNRGMADRPRGRRVDLAVLAAGGYEVESTLFPMEMPVTCVVWKYSRSVAMSR